MNRDGHNKATFFIGPEVEHTPAFSKKTLFVVGFQDTAKIEQLARDNRVPHIFLGANHSFDATHNTENFARTWNDQVTKLLASGFMVTLDYPAHQHVDVLKIFSQNVWHSRMFVPLLSVRIPYVETANPNLTVKIDDIDFDATNDGVWCMHFKEVTDSNRFTSWTEYGDDLVLEVEADPVEQKAKTPVLNDSSIGLDLTSPSLLKPENEEEKKLPFPAFTSPQDAAEAYTEGTTSDPLSPQESVKKTKAKAVK